MFEKNEIDKNFYDVVSDKFADYLIEVYKNQFVMNTIVFKNQQKTIEELYIPLHLNKISNDSKDQECIKIDSYKDELMPKYKRIIISDTAGMGKSTIMKWLFIHAIKEGKGIPIFIELRKLSEDNNVIKEIFKNINPIDNQFNTQYVLNLLKRGDFIFFFDGYDEIPTNDKVKVTEDLQRFISKAGENLFAISSREESALVSFGDFQCFNIKPLEKEEAYDLIRKYDNNGALSHELITKIESDENLSLLNEFLINPLMTSLLYKAYEYKKVIPYKKSIFYRQVYDALFEVHDFSKGGVYVHDKASKLDMDDFEEILKFISYKSFTKGKVIYEREELIGLIKEAKDINPKLQFKESAFLEDLIKNVPLFIKDGLDYKWTHKSFQEYFAAKYICHNLKDKQKDILVKMYKSNKNQNYFNVLDFCYDIDYLTFRKSIILDLVSNYIDHYNNTTIHHEDILKRKYLTFQYKMFFYANKMKNGESRHNDNTKAISAILKQRGLEPFWGLYTNDKYSVGYYKLPYSNIIKLLKNKGEDFVLTYSSKNSRNLALNGLPVNELIVLDESSENILNRNDNYSNVNELVSNLVNQIAREQLLTLNIEKCIKLKRDIEKEIEIEGNETIEF